MQELEIRPEDIEQFDRDGFIVFEEFLDPDEVDLLKSRFEPLFRGQWETGLAPDEVNWQYGRDSDDRTRQLCNTWKADYAVADIVLRPMIGRIAADVSAAGGRRALHAVDRPFPPDEHDARLCPLPAPCRHVDGRELLPHPLDPRRLPNAVAERLCREGRQGLRDGPCSAGRQGRDGLGAPNLAFPDPRQGALGVR